MYYPLYLYNCNKGNFRQQVKWKNKERISIYNTLCETLQLNDKIKQELVNKGFKVRI